MSNTTLNFGPIRQREYRARATQFLAGLAFPATKEQILACYTRKNTPMELIEDTLALAPGSFASPAAVAEALEAVHSQRTPHRWTSREIPVQ